jgi:radical SAM family protein
VIKTICFLTTYRCNAQCDFCECGPKARERIELVDMLRLIDEAAALGTISVVVFSGGEPTLLGGELFIAIRHASSKGLMTRVVTNGWWGRTPEKAEAFVDRLLSAGLTEINISIDDLHQEWIPLEHVRNSFLACYDRRLKCLIAHKRTKSATITRQSLEEYFGITFADYRRGATFTHEEECRLIATSTVIPVGRNEELAKLDDHLYTDWRGSCGSVLNDVIVGAGTNFLPCCGIITKGLPELTRNDLRTTRLIDAIDEANNDVMLNWIALEGPAAIAEFVKDKDPTVHFEDDYVGICHICDEVLRRPDVRRVLAAHIDEIVERVALHRAFLEAARSDHEVARIYIR